LREIRRYKKNINKVKMNIFPMRSTSLKSIRRNIKREIEKENIVNDYGN